MLLLALSAHADLPWDCPVTSTPEEVEPYRLDDVGAAEILQDLAAITDLWVDPACAWVTTTTGTHTETTTESVCTAADYETIVTTYTYEDAWEGMETETVDVSVYTGETWTHLVYSEASSWWEDSGSTYGGTTERTAEWSGAIAGLPDDASIRYTSEAWTSLGWTRDSVRVVTPTCTTSSERDQTSEPFIEGVQFTPGLSVDVWSGDWYLAGWCGSSAGGGAFADVDGVRYGAVDGTTWADDLADADRDGFAPPCDCDDADAARYYAAEDLANDGIDQDCDGADTIDYDLDGDRHDDVAYGGDDCDDADSTIYPGAPDDAGDGVDADCDGADDIDADGDGYTADGDDAAADCDEANAAIHPNAADAPCDGVDDDCDGVQDNDADDDGYDCVDQSGDDCDDSSRSWNPGAADAPCDGHDQDCDGSDDCDTGDSAAYEETAAPDDTAAPEPPPAEEDGSPMPEEPGCATVSAPVGLFAVAMLMARWKRARASRR